MLCSGEMLSAGTSRRLDVALGTLLVLISFTGVFDHGLWGTNDTRGAAMVLDMYRHGTWVIPTIDGQAYLEKPPLMHWVALAFARLFGGVTEGIARLPAVLAGLGTLLLMRRFVADPLAAWAGIFLCATTPTFMGYARAVMTDMILTFCVTLALWLFWRADEPGRAGALRWLPFLLASAAAFYAKGLVGPGLIWSAVAADLLWTRRPKLLLGLAAAFAPLFAATILPWVAALERSLGAEAVRYMFWVNQVGRFFDFREPSMGPNPLTAHKEPLYYYLTNLPLAMGTSVLLLAAALLVWWRRESVFDGRLATFVRCSMVGMLLLLHLSTARVAVYALPVFPFFFMATGIWLADFARRRRQALFERVLAGLSFGAWALLAAGVPAACIVFALRRPDLFLTEEGLGPGRFVLTGALCLSAVVLAVTVLVRQLNRGPRELLVPLLPVAGTVLLFLDYQLICPIVERHKSYVPFARFAQRESAGRELALGFPEYNAIGAFTFYLDRRLPILETQPEVAAYLSAAAPRAVIAARSDLPALAPALAAVPHDERVCSDPGARSHDFVLLTNRPAP